jgi:endonuclease/exonuclease/phosphatase family metal-dependent hydrolase
VARKKKLGCSLPLIAAVMLAVAADRLLGERETPSTTAPATHVDEPAPKAPAARRPTKPVPSPFPPGSPWESREACEAALRRTTPAKVLTPRIGTWNLAWFPAGTAKGDDPERARDVPWMACVIATLGVQVLAVQEVVQSPAGRAALLDLLRGLDGHTQGRWRAELDDCPDDGRQHVGFLFDEARVQLLSTEVLGALNPDRSKCDHRLRPGLAARFRYRKGGPDFETISVHFDSGVARRDFDNRRVSLSRLSALLPPRVAKHRDDDLIVLGDFNTMGCKTCEPAVAAAEEIAAFDAMADAFAPSLRNLVPDHACTEYYKGHGGRLDHVLVTRGMRELAASSPVTTHGVCAALRCERHGSVAHLPASRRLSDHCPVVLALQPKDAD